jgi:hypothetical protein
MARPDLLDLRRPLFNWKLFAAGMIVTINHELGRLLIAWLGINNFGATWCEFNANERARHVPVALVAKQSHASALRAIAAQNFRGHILVGNNNPFVVRGVERNRMLMPTFLQSICAHSAPPITRRTARSVGSSCPSW